MGDPATAAEQAALDRFRELLPDDGVTTAWANLTFFDAGGRSGEIDVLLLTPAGFYVVELKGWHGHLVIDQQYWNHNGRSMRSPRIVTNGKAKRLSGLLKHVAPRAQERLIPWVTEAVMLHGEGSKVAFRGPDARGAIYALDGYTVHADPLLPTLVELLEESPRHRPIDQAEAEEIRKICEKAGFRAAPKVRMVGSYRVADTTPIDEGPDWQDVVVEHHALPEVKKRLRLFDLPPKASRAERERLTKRAQDEYLKGHGLNHDRILRATDFQPTDDGPALVFDYDDAEVPLDAFMAGQGSRLTLEERLALVRDLGNVLQYTHRQRFTHRTLGPQKVWVAQHKGARPHLRVRDWFAAHRLDTTRGTTRHAHTVTSLGAGLEDEDQLYLAPEALDAASAPPPLPLDIYGFGTLAYLIVTGQPPVRSREELNRRLTEEGCLDPRAGADASIPAEVAEAIALMTSRSSTDRPASMDEALGLLDKFWEQRRVADQQPEAVGVDDAVDAQPEQMITDRFLVTQRRGEGGSSVALAVMDEDDPDREVIMKVARGPEHERLLVAEAETLRALKHRRIVSLIDGPLEVTGRKALLLTDAGSTTLADELSKQGRLTLEWQQRWGGQLLEAMTHLDEQGVFHRDIKPSNIGVNEDPGTRKPSLYLFDFTLSQEPLENTKSGTPGYIDPYLGTLPRRRYDRAAELWSVAVTLYEMAVGERPWWADGARAPLGSEPPEISAAQFETAVRVQQTEFFKKALHPDASRRFGSAPEMAQAWLEIFQTLETGPERESNDELADQASAGTPLEDAGLSAKALSALSRLEDVYTVEDLLGVPTMQVNSIRGLGNAVRQEISRRLKQWRQRLSHEPADSEDLGPGLERRIRTLLEAVSGEERSVLELVLGLSGEPAGGASLWPPAYEIAHRLDISRGDVERRLRGALEQIQRRHRTALDDIREEITVALGTQGGIAAVSAFAQDLGLQHPSVLAWDERRRHGAAMLRLAVEYDQTFPEPWLEIRRRTQLDPLLALSDVAENPPVEGGRRPPEMLFDVAERLGQEVQALVGTGKIVPRSEALEVLRRAAGELTLGERWLPDHRLLKLAAESSPDTELSTQQELYSVDLQPKQALEHVMRGKTGRALQLDDLRKSVERRFRAVTLPPDGDIRRLIQEIDPNLEYREGQGYMPKTIRHFTRSTTTFAEVSTTPEAVSSLERSLLRRSGLTLTVRPRMYTKTAAQLCRSFGVTEIDISQILVDTLRQAATEANAQWEQILEFDAHRSKDDAEWRQHQSIVKQLLGQAWQETLERPEPLLITYPGPLLRYGLGNALAELHDAGTARPAARWVLIPMEASNTVPRLDGEDVPLGASGWVNLPRDIHTLVPSHSTTATGGFPA